MDSDKRLLKLICYKSSKLSIERINDEAEIIFYD